MLLRLAFIQYIKMFFTWDMIYTVFYMFLHILPPELSGLLCPRIVPFADHLKFFVKARHQTLSAIRFWKSSNSCTWISGMPFFLKNISFSIFDQFLMHQKKFSGFFAIAEYVISRHISRCTFRICIVLYGYKLVLMVEIKVRLNWAMKLKFSGNASLIEAIKW